MDFEYEYHCETCGNALMKLEEEHGYDGGFICPSGCEHHLPNCGVKLNIGSYTLEITLSNSKIRKVICIKDSITAGFFTDQLFEDMHNDIEALRRAVTKMERGK
jgi:hypothetical protein